MLEVRLSHPPAGVEVAFQAGPGVTALFGPSGAGKTTVLHAIAGLIRPKGAQVLLDGRPLHDLAPHRRGVAVVFQEARLFPHLSVRQNLAYGQRWAPPGGPGFAEVAALLGLQALLDRPPLTLSGGEAQRVAIGRALLSHPGVLLLDEPLSALDAPRKAEILPWLEALVARARLPVIYVSHALSEVTRLAERMIVLQAGRIRAEGSLADLLSDPGLVPLLGSTEAGSVVEAVAAETAADGLVRLVTAGGDLHLALRAAPGERLRLRLPAQDIILSRHRPEGLSALNVLSGRIQRLQDEDGSVLVQLHLAPGVLCLARITRRSALALALAPGQEVFAILKTVALARSL